MADLLSHIDAFAQPTTDRQALVDDTLAMVLEAMPNLEAIVGSSPGRRNRLGEAVLAAIETVVAEARDEDARLAAEEAQRDTSAAPDDEPAPDAG